MLIANLNIMANTFVKIAKTFVELSVMIVVIKRRPILISYLEQNMQKWIAKMNSGQKTG